MPTSTAWPLPPLHFRNADAELAISYRNDRARSFVEPLAQEFSAPISLPCGAPVPGRLEAVFETIKKRWGRLDFLIAWSRKADLHGTMTDCSAEGFAESMLISCHSLIGMAKRAEPLMTKVAA